MLMLGRTILCVLAVSHVGRSLDQGAPNGNATINGNGTLNRNATNITLPVECGKRGPQVIRDTPVVFGGSDAYLGMHPWIAALGYTWKLDTPIVATVCPWNTNRRRFKALDDERRKIYWDCAGSLVTKRHVVTAANCTAPGERFLRIVRLGDLNLNDCIQDGASPADYEVDKVIQHPDYSVLSNDIAVVRLKKTVTFTRHIQPICLPTLEEFRTKDFTGHRAYVVGWGEQNAEGQQSTHLQEWRTNIFNNTVCKEAYAKISGLVNDSRVICADGNGTYLDHGGPLMVRHGPDSAYYLYGVVSVGYESGTVLIDMFTRITEFLNWTLSNLK